MKVLAVIPARGGSKRIRRKNLRLLHGKPLIAYILGIAQASHFIDDIIVSTDDSAIAEYVRNAWHVPIRDRPEALAKDHVPLDPVIYDAVLQAECQRGYKYDIVVTLQPTSPTLTSETLDLAISEFLSNSCDTIIAVVEDSHLGWKRTGGEPVPLYDKRQNRQWLPTTYRETGAFVISKRQVVTQESRFGESVNVFPISREEAVDIDDEVDWLLARSLLEQLRIAFVVSGSRHLGMGHVYRALTLADALLGNHLHFLAYDSDDKTVDFLKRQDYPTSESSDKQDLLQHLEKFHPDVVVNDILDTDEEYITYLRSKGYFVVNFEDLGRGSLQANLVFNALYESSSPPPNHRFGAQYVCLREEFVILPPAPLRDKPTTLLVTFGGVDENNLTVRTCRILPRLLANSSLKRVIIILGPGYAHRAEFDSCVEQFSGELRSNIEVYKSVKNMAKLIREGDVAVTSNGRTVYELAAMGVPGVAIAQNDRETLHLFSRYSEGFHYLGIAGNIKEQDIAEAVESIVRDRDVRAKMARALLQENLKSGIDRVQREIMDEYWRWKDAENKYRTTRADKR